jgi:D-hydroxyproline dehydrogenase subunit beta
VLATGIAAAALAPEADVVPRKGHLVITDRYPGLVSHQLIELGYLKSAHSLQTDSVAFNVQPRPTGQVLIGSSRQFGCDEPAVDNRVLSRMLARTFEYMPALRKCSALRSWTGFRAATPDKLPLIGPSLHADNVLLATGHEGLGITTSLGTAKLIAKLLLGTTCGTSVLPYLPKRSFAHA